MHRRGGLLLLGATGLFLVWTMLLSPVTLDIGYDWDEDRNVTVKVQHCGTALGVVTGNLDPSVPGFRTAQDCRATAWGRIVINGLIGVAGIAAGIWAVRRGWYEPRPTDAVRTLPSRDGQVAAKRDRRG